MQSTKLGYTERDAATVRHGGWVMWGLPTLLWDGTVDALELHCSVVAAPSVPSRASTFRPAREWSWERQGDEGKRRNYRPTIGEPLCNKSVRGR